MWAGHTFVRGQARALGAPIVGDLRASVECPKVAGCRPWIARDMRHSRGADRRQLCGLTPAGRIRLPRAPDRAYAQRKPTGPVGRCTTPNICNTASEKRRRPHRYRTVVKELITPLF